MENPTKNPIRRVQKFEGFMVNVGVMNDEKSPLYEGLGLNISILMGI